MATPVGLADVSDVWINIWKHLLQELGIIVVDTLFSETFCSNWICSVEEILLKLFAFITFIDCFSDGFISSAFLEVLWAHVIKRAASSIILEILPCSSVRGRTALTVAYTQPQTLLRVHQLHNIGQPRFQQQIVFLFDQLLSTQHRWISFKRSLRTTGWQSQAIAHTHGSKSSIDKDFFFFLFQWRNGSFHLW